MEPEGKNALKGNTIMHQNQHKKVNFSQSCQICLVYYNEPVEKMGLRIQRELDDSLD